MVLSQVICGAQQNGYKCLFQPAFGPRCQQMHFYAFEMLNKMRYIRRYKKRAERGGRTAGGS